MGKDCHPKNKIRSQISIKVDITSMNFDVSAGKVKSNGILKNEKADIKIHISNINLDADLWPKFDLCVL